MATALNCPLPELEPISELHQSNIIRVRSAHLRDLDRLGDLWFYQRQYHERWDELYTSDSNAQIIWKEQIQSSLEQPNHCVLVAEDALGKIVGYIHGSFYPWPFSPQEYYGSLNTIAVAEEIQDQGIGKKLVESLLQWFRYQQVDHISVHVDHRNRKAIKLYEKVGFRSYQYRLMLNLEILS
ncbi:MAG: GNAT family N-acetyltransferase [Candidatus Hodarchaeota archaeon]